jgi:Ca2+-binding RTX toxin-like protein
MSARHRIRRTIVGAVGAGATFIGGAALAVTPAEAAPAVTVRLVGDVLIVTGDPVARNSLVVGQTPAHVITLNGTPVLGGTATTANVHRVRMVGGGGIDTLRFDETNGTMPPGEFAGGAGNDTLDGGSSADTLDGGTESDKIAGHGGDDKLVGGAGNDKVIGGTGNDTVTLGADSDQFTWNPGDGKDRVDGDAGTDTLLFNGSDVDTAVGVAPRASIRLVAPPFDTVDYSGFEQLKIDTAGGSDTDQVFVGDMSGTGLAAVRVDFGPPTANDIDRAGVLSGNSPVQSRIRGSRAAGVSVSGMAAPVLISGAEELDVTGGAGADVLDASALAAGALDVLDMGGENGPTTNSGRNTLIGGPGDDLLFGGSGGDRIEGRGGNDELFGSTADDQLFGGDGDDTLIGRGGHDVLDGGPGNNVIIP